MAVTLYGLLTLNRKVMKLQECRKWWQGGSGWETVKCRKRKIYVVIWPTVCCFADCSKCCNMTFGITESLPCERSALHGSSYAAVSSVSASVSLCLTFHAWLIPRVGPHKHVATYAGVPLVRRPRQSTAWTVIYRHGVGETVYHNSVVASGQQYKLTYLIAGPAIGLHQHSGCDVRQTVSERVTPN